MFLDLFSCSTYRNNHLHSAAILNWTLAWNLAQIYVLLRSEKTANVIVRSDLKGLKCNRFVKNKTI